MICSDISDPSNLSVIEGDMGDRRDNEDTSLGLMISWGRNDDLVGLTNKAMISCLRTDLRVSHRVVSILSSMTCWTWSLIKSWRESAPRDLDLDRGLSWKASSMASLTEDLRCS